MCDGNVGLMTFNNGNYLASALSTSRISLNINQSVDLSTYSWCATCGICQEYNIIIDSFYMDRTTLGNSIPMCMCAQALSKENLLIKINQISHKKGGPVFLNIYDAMLWAQNQGMFITNQNYPRISTLNHVLLMDAGLPASYPFSGNTWFNMAANNNIGTLNGGITFDDTAVSDPYGHLQFDGSNDYVSFSAATNIPVGSSSYSISVWFNPDTLSNQGLIGWGTYANNNESNSIKFTSTGIINSWGTNQLSASTVITTSTWHNIVATFDGTTRKLYYDGNLLDSDTPTGLNVVGSSNLTIGRVDTQYFDGGLSIAQIFPQALTDIDVSSSYQAMIQRYDGTCMDICPEEVIYCTTPTPTPTCNTSFTPEIEEFFPVNCNNNCLDQINGGWNGRDYELLTYCLDLSNGYYAVSSTVGLNYNAYFRPNKFNFYIDNVLSQTSGWVGLDDTYPGPWGAAGAVNAAGTVGSFIFTYDNSKTYRIDVEVGPANPSDPSDNDNFTIEIACPNISPTPTPTMTPTPGPWYCRYQDPNSTGWQWYIFERGRSNYSYERGVYNPVTKTLVGLPGFWDPPRYNYIGYMEVIVWDCLNQPKPYVVDKWDTRLEKPRRVWPSNQLKQLPAQTNVYVAGLFTVDPYSVF